MQLLTLLFIQGVWDLEIYCRDIDGKDSLPLYCPFGKQFYLFWESHNMDGLFVGGKKIVVIVTKKMSGAVNN